jgi:hypothetical protein
MNKIYNDTQWGWFVDIPEEVLYDKQKINNITYKPTLPTIYSINSFKSVNNLSLEFDNINSKLSVNKSNQLMEFRLLFLLISSIMFIIFVIHLKFNLFN